MEAHSLELLNDFVKLLLKVTQFQRAVLINCNDKKLSLEFESTVNTYRSLGAKSFGDVHVYQSVPTTIISYVATEQKGLVVSEFSIGNNFAKDVYFKNNLIKWVICIPLVYKDSLCGILYIENRSSNPGNHNYLKNLKVLIKPFASLFHYVKNNENHATQIKERTSDEYNKSLTEINRLKATQDGDYFLISLLLSPLQANRNNSSNVLTDFYVEQKKKFKFKKWSSEIGGDICKTDTIGLSDAHQYTVFVNGDAMGKSIQGASGALILGVVFDAVLTRSKVKKNMNQYPEIWLKELYMDLHNVFLSFEGSMYISVCMGLIDNDNGMMYYINVEHPWTILYRDEDASFIDEELKIRKIGTPEQDEYLEVKMFQLQESDVIIIGSDGKDDISIVKEDGSVDIQSDEKAILSRVVESKADMGGIVEKLKEMGSITDDLSLLKIQYHTKKGKSLESKLPEIIGTIIKESSDFLKKNLFPEALERIKTVKEVLIHYPEIYKFLGKVYYNEGDFFQSVGYFQEYLNFNPEDDLYMTSVVYQYLIKMLGDTYYQMEEYSIAIECFDEYLNIMPVDNEYIYKVSISYYNLGDYDKAADFGERLYLRNQKDYYNLLNLARVYHSLNVKHRALKMIQKAIELRPTDEIAEKLKNDIMDM
ncbi:MAG: SpoIIE family protein phosphatase [Leptospiraceae bacterium]|nr:SpoIIE family protein phosphatase [Leptospiraceae bacterium]MCP5497460.1 SpoIIE family protein phosphatase [Leptospiraceae bacterium]